MPDSKNQRKCRRAMVIVRWIFNKNDQLNAASITADTCARFRINFGLYLILYFVRFIKDCEQLLDVLNEEDVYFRRKYFSCNSRSAICCAYTVLSLVKMGGCLQYFLHKMWNNVKHFSRISFFVMNIKWAIMTHYSATYIMAIRYLSRLQYLRHGITPE